MSKLVAAYIRISKYDEKDSASPNYMDKYYSEEEQNKYGVLGIKVKNCKEII